MDTGNFDLYAPSDVEQLKKISDMSSEFEKRLVELTETQHDEMKEMQPTQRKGYMRNQPCVCGSQIKFKKCCWNYYEKNHLPVAKIA